MVNEREPMSTKKFIGCVVLGVVLGTMMFLLMGGLY